MSDSETYFNYWGKTGKDGTYHLLPYHCLDVAAVGKVLLEKNAGLCRRLSIILGLESDLLVQWAAFFLTLHDIGKFSTVFQQKDPAIFRILQGEKPLLVSRGKVFHDSFGYLLWQNTIWSRFEDRMTNEIKENHDLVLDIRDTLSFLMMAVAGHHGEPPKTNDGQIRFRPQRFFTSDDIEAAEKFTETVLSLHVRNPASFFEKALKEERCRSVSWWLAGLTVVADWIGSNAEYFPLLKHRLPLHEYFHDYAMPRAQESLQKSGLLPVDAKPFAGASGLFPSIESMTPLQKAASSTPLHPGPQLWILEDATGSGKTEAALILAHRLMNEKNADGVFIGLPTMATANAMYDRTQVCYRHFFSTPEKASLVLSHSARHLSETFRQSIIYPLDQGNVKNIGERTGSSQCAAWLADNRKKAMLAHIGVGTIDQALLGILPARHQCLRLFGLATKVLVVDEVHAYDSYMLELVQRLIAFQARIGGSVILLSATLPISTKEKLVSAYKGGLDVDTRIGLNKDAYPLALRFDGRSCMEKSVNPAKWSHRNIGVKFSDDLESLIDLAVEKSLQGNCVCWIRNTVADAVELFRRLKGDNRIESDHVQLFHARFILADRLRIEGEVLNRFGKHSSESDRRGRVLIATQVVEQSLDLDFDAMISDLAPMDLMIQRAGRLRRHNRDGSGNLVEGELAEDGRGPATLYVYGPPATEDAGKDWYSSVFPKAAAVYPNAAFLWRTARILQEENEIRIPDRARYLIESVFGTDALSVPKFIEEVSRKAEGEAYAARSQANYFGLNAEDGYERGSGLWDDEEGIPTRLGEKTVSLYLCREKDGRLVPLPGEQEHWDMSRVSVNERYLKELEDVIENNVEDKIEGKERAEKKVLSLVEKSGSDWVSVYEKEGERAIYSKYEGFMPG